MKKKGHLIWITGYFGAGKTTMMQAVLDGIPSLSPLTVLTTRPPRPGEKDQQKPEYKFISKEEYLALLNAGKIHDHSIVEGSYYGTNIEDANAKLCAGIDLICIVVPDPKLLAKFVNLYTVQPVIIWIDTPFSVANQRISLLRPERLNHRLHNEATREMILEIASYSFAPTEHLDEDKASFVNLVKKALK